jgi:ubiquinol-cytochrome c reductase cytochrome b subunit
MGVSIFIFFLVPWLDRSPVKSIRYRGPLYRTALAIFAISFVALGYLGTQSPTEVLTWLARIFSITYFAFFFLMPFYTRWDKDKPVPERVTSK